MLDLLDRRIEIIGAGGILALIPILRYIFFRKTKQNDDIVLELLDHFISIIEEHKSRRDENDEEETKDVIHMYLHEIAKNQKEPYPVDYIHQRHLVALIDALFLAGSETSSSSLSFLLLTIADKPHVQEQVQEEILKVCGPSGLPSFADQDKMPYTQAVIMEVSRLYTVAPLGKYRLSCRCSARFHSRSYDRGSVSRVIATEKMLSQMDMILQTCSVTVLRTLV